jgi:hypothetical protein
MSLAHKDAPALANTRGAIRERVVALHTRVVHATTSTHVRATPERRTHAAEPRRATELTWRTPPTQREEAPTHAPTATTWERTPQVQASASNAIEAAIEQTRRTVERQAPLLEPALVERVADDVLRRIDHRLRIERERRGL